MSYRRLFAALADGDLAGAMELADCDGSDFAQAVATLTGQEVDQCGDCGSAYWSDDLTPTKGGDSVCDECRRENYTCCASCDEYVKDEDTSGVAGGDSVCESCIADGYSYCDECEEYFPDGDHAHESDDCGCESPIMRFRFPANGDGTVDNDTRLLVNPPGGVIPAEGLAAIVDLVYRSVCGDWPYPYEVGQLVDSIGPEWQTKRGNFTKRLTRALHLKRGLHLSNETVSEVGNIARAHSSTGTDWRVEFTRDLNQTADAFYHGDSCWWQSYASSRCALKNWGGLGMRSYGERYVSGRAWVQPLDSTLRPTHRTEDAFAYVVYNGYGDLSGYVPARIIAHLTGRSYTKVKLTLGCQYINNDSGYLVADPATCEETNSLNINHDEHYQADASTVLNELRVSVA